VQQSFIIMTMTAVWKFGFRGFEELDNFWRLDGLGLAFRTGWSISYAVHYIVLKRQECEPKRDSAIAEVCSKILSSCAQRFRRREEASQIGGMNGSFHKRHKV
jgi:predicted acetyltransferase